MSGPAFTVANVAYFLGALLVMGAMGWLMSSAWESLGGKGILTHAALYGGIFALAGQNLWLKEGRQIPGGLLVTMAVWMVPLAIYGLERMMGWWPQGDPGKYRDYYVWVKGSWFFMEAGTIAAGLLALRLVRFPFLTFPIAFALWFMSMDLTPLIFGKQEYIWKERLWVSLIFGLVMTPSCFPSPWLPWVFSLFSRACSFNATRSASRRRFSNWSRKAFWRCIHRTGFHRSHNRRKHRESHAKTRRRKERQESPRFYILCELCAFA